MITNIYTQWTMHQFEYAQMSAQHGGQWSQFDSE